MTLPLLILALLLSACSSPQKIKAQASWNESADADTYLIYMALQPGAKRNSVSALFETQGTQYLIEDLEVGKSYYFQISSKNEAGESEPSPEVEFKP